ncbi:MAG: ATP-binding protein [Clostridiales bacterium 41_21_two_genomes]|nr:MAG: ATP-binding protein [Clostridiales bacterium 41_21_two_genomes]
MKLFLDYISKIKFYIILQLFPVMLAEIIFFLYQLPIEPMVYVTVFWLITGICACLNGFYRYRKKVEQLELIAAAPDINLSQMDSPVGQDERFQQEIMQQLNQMRIDVENASQKSSEDMTDYYTMWAHQIKTPIFALRLLLQESTEENKEKLSELFKIEQYVEMVLGYLRTEDMSSDLKLSRCSLDRIIRDQIHKYAGIFVSKKLTLTYESISQDVLTDEKWLGFVIGQILSNALKYTRTGGIRIYLEKKLSLDTDDVSISIRNDDCNKVENLTLIIEDTGIGIRAEDIPRIFEKGYTGVNGRDDNRATGIGLYLSNKIMRKLGHRLYITSTEGKGTKVFLEFSVEDLNMY